MQRHGFGLFDLDLAEQKSFSFLVSMVSFMTFQNVPLQGDQQKIGKNLDVSKLEICVKVQDFFS
jgi:hypothetical protein